jgi:hypothetical protein
MADLTIYPVVLKLVPEVYRRLTTDWEKETPIEYRRSLYFVKDKIIDKMIAHDITSCQYHVVETSEAVYHWRYIKTIERISDYAIDLWWLSFYSFTHLTEDANKSLQTAISEQQMAPKQNKKQLPAYYASLYILLTVKANQLGYALGIHGSMKRDLDLIAMPWTEMAVSRKHLIAKLAIAVGGVHSNVRDVDHWKPFGRVSSSIHLEEGLYIDISVAPRINYKTGQVIDSLPIPAHTGGRTVDEVYATEDVE